MKQIIPLVVAAAVGVGAYFAFFHEGNAPEEQAAVTPPTTSETQDTAGTGEGETGEGEAAIDISVIPDMSIGNPDAPVTVIEYASYTCPHCASFHAGTYKDLKKNYIDTGKINFVYREVYFDRYGLWASMIARCAGPEKFFGVTDLLFAGQSTWARAGEPAAIIEELRKVGRLAGMSDDMLDSCLNDEGKAKTLVEWYKTRAGDDGINSTPSFVINGTTYNNMSYSEMSEILDKAAN